MQNVLRKFRPHALRVMSAGGRLYVVGGAVRDFVMRRTFNDVDLCVTGLTAAQFLRLFPDARQQGKAFPVFVVDESEVALARTEKKIGVGYSGFEVNASPTVCIEEDLLRRDLTFNAMAIDILTGELIDPYGGTRDIFDHMVRPTSAAFMEDPVRALRAARFSAEFDFRVSPTVYNYINRVKAEIPTINDNLKFKEFKRAIVGKAPVRFFQVLQHSRVLREAFPELNALDGMEQRHHTDGDALEHTFAVLKTCRALTDDPYILTAAVYHDTGKGTTPTEILPRHSDHEKRSVKIIEELTWMPNDFKRYAKAVALDHMRGHVYRDMRRGSRVSFLERIMATSKGLDGFCTVLFADRPTPETTLDILQMHVEAAKIESITGLDLPETTPKGELFGQVLHQMKAEKLGE